MDSNDDNVWKCQHPKDSEFIQKMNNKTNDIIMCRMCGRKIKDVEKNVS